MPTPFDLSRRTLVKAALGAAASVTALQANARSAQSHQVADGASPGRSNAKSASKPPEKLTVTMLLFPGTTVLDWVGPYEALHRVPGVEVILAAETLEPMVADSGVMRYLANQTIDQITRTDILLIPGGAAGVRDAANNPKLIEWIKRIDQTTRYTTSVCTGALILARAGLLNGRKATTHWAVQDMLAKSGAEYVAERWVVSDKYWTAAGVSSGIDMTLALIGAIYGDEVAMKTQLQIEYDPKPPYQAGSERSAPPHIVESIRAESARSRAKAAQP